MSKPLSKNPTRVAMLMRELDTRTVKIQNLCADSNKELLNYFQKNRCSEQFFNRGSKAIRDCFRFAFLGYVIGPENSSFFLNQSDLKLKPT